MGSGHVVYSQKNRQEGKANHAENPKIFAPAVSLCDPGGGALDVLCLYAGHKKSGEGQAGGAEDGRGRRFLC